MTQARTLGRAGMAMLLGLGLTLAAPVTSDGMINDRAAEAPATASSTPAAGPVDGRIVYVNGDNLQLETANPDGTAVVPLTDFADGVAMQPNWLPDSSGVVFVSDRTPNGDLRLFSIRRNGTHVHKIANDRPGVQTFTPAVTPDGQSVVFSRCRPDPPGGCALYRVDLDGTGLHPITGYGDRGDFWPDVSPNGKLVAFSRFEDRGITVQTWVMRIDGTHAHPITPPALEASYPRWLPNGRRLLVVSQWPHLGQSIHRIDADGSNRQLLSEGHFPNNESFATPSPSGQQILFVSDRNYPDLAGFDLFTMNGNGSNQQLIRSGAFFASDWGSAPLLPGRASSPRAKHAQPATTADRRALQHALGHWAPYLAPKAQLDH